MINHFSARLYLDMLLSYAMGEIMVEREERAWEIVAEVTDLMRQLK